MAAADRFVLSLVLASAAIAGASAQDGVVFTFSKLAPDITRLNPLSYFGRIFSSAGLVELLKSAIKIVVIILVAWKTARWGLTMALEAHDIAEGLAALGAASRRILYISAAIALVTAAGDYAHKRYEHETELRMTRQEFLDQLKQDEGNPLIKRAIRKAQRKRHVRRLAGIHQAATATVVLTNPTHFAVALRYRRGFDPAPLVVAKGAGENAQRIKEIARLAAVPIMENKPLARALFKSVEVGEQLPRQFYRAIAEVLAAIMRAEARRDQRRSRLMASAAPQTKFISASEIALPATAMLVLAGMVAPVGPTVLDVMLSLSIALSITVLVVSASNRSALDFSAFPTVLLVATLMRLSLNVASTRLILLHGDRGPDAAGSVIESFGRVIVGDNYAIGIVVFIVIAIINFAVVTKGASRVAEVAARFTLDSMPGKQMAIDADLNSGSIGEEEARKRRRDLAREADFYAAMDGIGKFVRGDAIAAIMIMAINLIAGLFVGVIQHGLSLMDALAHLYDSDRRRWTRGAGSCAADLDCRGHDRLAHRERLRPARNYRQGADAQAGRAVRRQRNAGADWDFSGPAAPRVSHYGGWTRRTRDARAQAARRGRERTRAGEAKAAPMVSRRRGPTSCAWNSAPR